MSPLQRPLSDHDVGIGAFGEATVERLMPGVGVFEASAPDIVLSQQSAFRRERLDRDGLRFFPNESATDSQQTTRSRQRFTWPGASQGQCAASSPSSRSVSHFALPPALMNSSNPSRAAVRESRIPPLETKRRRPLSLAAEPHGETARGMLGRARSARHWR